MDLQTLVQRLGLAWQRRAPLRAQGLQAYRWVNGAGDGLEGVTLDVFADVGVMSLYRDLPPDEEALFGQALPQAARLRAVYLKRRPKEARQVATTRKGELAPEAPWLGAPVDVLWPEENGLAFRIEPGQGLAVGLYLDMRDIRQWLKGKAKGQTVLNAFAYTCAFGIYAQAGGAARVLNLDLSRRVLDFGKANAQKNGLSVSDRDYLAGDVFDWFARLAKKGETFGQVILDPPSFATTQKGRFSAASDYDRLVTLAARLVASGGLLLACCNQASLSAQRFEVLVHSGLSQAGRRAKRTETLLPSAVDFPPPPGEEPPLKVRALWLD